MVKRVRLRSLINLWILVVLAFFILESRFLSILPADDQEMSSPEDVVFNTSYSEENVTKNGGELVINRTKLRDILRIILRRHENLNTDSSRYKFNVTASNLLSLDREIPDLRPETCKTLAYDIPQPVSVSVVIIFHNDALTMLLRTVHSIINRSSANMLKEIILVDDRSDHADLAGDLDLYVSKLFPLVRVIRNERREGLVRSRLRGANNATGDVLIFFDAHMECADGWLEPLVYQLQRNKAWIVQPHVDEISGSDITYFTKDTEYHVRGGLTWDLSYAYYKIPKVMKMSLLTPDAPYPTPVLLGCAIAVWRENFNAIGQFDDSLNIWGGEHIELSVRTWLCGGRVLTIPCSHVGHLFKNFAYSFNGDTGMIILKNLNRVADLWLEKYLWINKAITADYAAQTRRTAAEVKSLAERREFLRKLKCRDFDWYLEAVLPELPIPPKATVYFGELFPFSRTDTCLSVLQDGGIGLSSWCSAIATSPKETFTLDRYNRLLHFDKCVYIRESSQSLMVERCSLNKTATWTYHDKYLQMKVTSRLIGTKCVAMTNDQSKPVTLEECSRKDDLQKWRFRYHKFSTIN